MRSETSKGETPLPCADPGDRSRVWHIILQGLTLPALLAVIGVAVIVLIMLTRMLIDPARFFVVQQLIFAIVMIAGLALAIYTFIVTVKHALRRIETWRQSGHTTKVTAGLVALTLVAIIIVLPILLALFVQ
jgi:hypothetical protein